MTPQDRKSRAEGQRIDALFDRGKRKEARALIKRRLREVGEDDWDAHWLWCRLSWSYYYVEQDGKRALQYALKARDLAPACPMVVSSRVYALIRLERYDEAIPFSNWVVKQGLVGFARNPCYEGVRHARGDIADAHYDLAYCFDKLGRKALAMRHLKKHMALRGPGALTGTSFKDARELLKELGAPPARKRPARKR